MAYDIEKLVEKIKEDGVAKKGPGPSKDLTDFIKLMDEIRKIALMKQINRLPFSTTATGIAAQLGLQKSKNRVFQIAKTAVKYVDGVEVEKVDGRLWLVFSQS